VLDFSAETPLTHRYFDGICTSQITDVCGVMVILMMMMMMMMMIQMILLAILGFSPCRGNRPHRWGRLLHVKFYPISAVGGVTQKTKNY